MGRFPYELPSGLPDEQVDLMLAYLAIVREEEEAGDRGRHHRQGVAAERALQDMEAEAWASSRR